MAVSRGPLKFSPLTDDWRRVLEGIGVKDVDRFSSPLYHGKKTTCTLPTYSIVFGLRVVCVITESFPVENLIKDLLRVEED